jgi:hypothetical protein
VNLEIDCTELIREGRWMSRCDGVVRGDGSEARRSIQDRRDAIPSYRAYSAISLRTEIIISKYDRWLKSDYASFSDRTQESYPRLTTLPPTVGRIARVERVVTG